MSARGLRKCAYCRRKLPVKRVHRVWFELEYAVVWLCKAEWMCASIGNELRSEP